MNRTLARRGVATCATLIVVGLILLAPSRAAACPFCSAVSLTLSEEIASNDVAVVARLVERPATSDPSNPAGDTARFEIVDVLKGAGLLGDTKEIDVLYFGRDPEGTLFYILGTEPPNFNWTTPVALSDRAVEYVRKLPELPEKGADRLVFFQEYFEDAEEMLARDAYDEFAKAPYAEVKELADRMHHDRLIRWINDRDVPASRRRLYLTMLGTCGTADDLPMLEEMIRSDDREIKSALDAMIACYLTLKGPDGLPLVDELFLIKKDAEYTDTYAAIMALRFHGQEADIVPRERLTQSLRYMLDRPELADLVIPDLARWEDWSAMDRLVELFKQSDDKSSWVRVPVINYLRACPDSAAKAHLDELAQLDPESMKRASSFFPFAAAAPAPEKVTRAEGDSSPSETEGTAASAAGIEQAVDLLVGESDSPAANGDESAVIEAQATADDAAPIVAADSESTTAAATATPQAAGAVFSTFPLVVGGAVATLIAVIVVLALTASAKSGRPHHSEPTT